MRFCRTLAPRGTVLRRFPPGHSTRASERRSIASRIAQSSEAIRDAPPPLLVQSSSFGPNPPVRIRSGQREGGADLRGERARLSPTIA